MERQLTHLTSVLTARATSSSARASPAEPEGLRGSPAPAPAAAASEDPRGSPAPAPAATETAAEGSEDPRGSPPAADEEWPKWEEPAPAADMAGGAAAAASGGGPLLLFQSWGFDVAVKSAQQDGATFAILVECPC